MNCCHDSRKSRRIWLMRYANVQTSMQFYVDLDVDEMADDLWAKHAATAGSAAASSNISSNTGPETAEPAEVPDSITPSIEGTCYAK